MVEGEKHYEQDELDFNLSPEDEALLALKSEVKELVTAWEKAPTTQMNAHTAFQTFITNQTRSPALDTYIKENRLSITTAEGLARLQTHLETPKEESATSAEIAELSSFVKNL